MEIFDLYTSDRVLSGKTMDRGTNVPDGFYRLVVHICIFNSRGELLIQHRQVFKSGWSDLWDLSAGGGVISGENSRSGAQRELFEEIGVNYDFETCVPFITASFVGGFDDIYIIHKDIEVSDLILQEEEVKDAKWASLDEVLALIKSKEFIPYDENLIRLLFSAKDRRTMHTSIGIKKEQL